MGISRSDQEEVETTSITQPRVGRCRSTYRSWRRRPLVAKVEYLLFWKARRMPGVRRLLHRLFEADLRRLNDTLASTPLSGKYWVWGGLLLGWAREGRVLVHDDMDADFCVLSDDWDSLEYALPKLHRSGFRGHLRFRDPSGLTTILVLVRHGARFEFYRMRQAKEKLLFSVYGTYLGEQFEVTQFIPSDTLEPFLFLGRTWLKAKHHERELAHLYGQWRQPEENWSYIAPKHYEIERKPWVTATSKW